MVFEKIEGVSEDPIALLRNHLASLPTPTALTATVKTLIRVLLQHAALLTGSSHLVYGTSLTTLAVSLISGVSGGGGFHVKEEAQEEWVPDEWERQNQHSTGTKLQSVRLIRPLRDVGRKECAAWSWWTGLKVIGREEVLWPGTKPGIGKLTEGM